MEDLLSKENISSESPNQSRGQNALQRRALQLRRWAEWTAGEAERARVAPSKVHFSAATLFLSAVAQNDAQECERLLRTTRDTDVNATTGDGLTALHQMAIDDNRPMCEWLLRHGADANCRDNEGWTPLHASASCGHAEVVRLLLARPEVDVFAVNCDGELARDVADGDECLRPIEERMLAQLPPTTTTRDDSTDDALIPESLLRELRAKEQKRIEEDFAAFEAHNASPTAEAVREWLERTRDPTSSATVLHVCAAKGYAALLERILDALSAEPTLVDALVDADGFTATHAAAFWQQTQALETLLSFGANLDLKTSDAREIIDLCHENPKVAELLLETRKARESATEKPKASETQRKLNAKRQRETRRPTQGVSKEDVEMALKTTTPSDDCLNDASTPPPMPSSPPPTTPPTPTPPAATETLNGVQPPVLAARRRPKRRSTGIEDNLELTDFKATVTPSDVANDCSDSFTTTTPTTRSRSSSRGSLPTTDNERETTTRQVTTADDKDYKKLYNELLIENQFLLKKMKDFEIVRRVDKEAQDFQREKRQLLRRVSELEEELKTTQELMKENARLKDENAALIRVISKLSK